MSTLLLILSLVIVYGAWKGAFHGPDCEQCLKIQEPMRQAKLLKRPKQEWEPIFASSEEVESAIRYKRIQERNARIQNMDAPFDWR